MSNGALCAVSTQPRAKARKPGSTAPAAGACRTIASVMPVSSVMSRGMGLPGLIRVANSAGGLALTRTAPISVMLASSGSQPVVSTSTTTKSRLAIGPVGTG